ncbi:acyl-CoA:diacylglycerol acyltransferase 1-related enzyme [Cardiosporidium cionae]|uniref:O-acyltransferase n=1 Tax=Cardiosporidium cionae TaxID=476202 RepID=A0ABQ7JCL4_9APIC|nr:acyl-CoA:diacylglycerol acyltransferase 1-related enzyme [Cardiosporidium cionae]|eukprot:KAF8821716.1 acyl-CoA:diacylglycerol acyltransferase 1-related enzyme [Cardiosporidium cionae]
MEKRRSARLAAKNLKRDPSSSDKSVSASVEKSSSISRDNRGRPLHDRSHEFIRPSLLSHDSMHIPLWLAWLLERYISPHALQPFGPLAFILKAANSAILVLLPYCTVYYLHPNPIGSTILLTFSIVWLFKLLSFHHVCFDIRRATHTRMRLKDICYNEKETKVAEQYPRCLTLSHFYRFIVMPTMCFQFHYPTTPCIRWLVVLRHVLEAFACIALIKIIVEQYIFITLKNTFSFDNLHSVKLSVVLAHFLESVLKLSIPNLYVWLLFFMLIFHHWCNILGEITRFGDRRFYEDWWNASSFDEYWRRWNLPVYQFLNRHVNKPLLSSGIPRIFSSIIVFTISALLHEYLISVPLQLGWIGLAFWGFIAQIPLMYVTKLKFFQTHKTIGNVVFWCVFCFSGQPIGTLSYFYLWAVRQGTVLQLDASIIASF